MTGSCSHVPGAVYIQHSEARVGTKDAVLQRLEIWAVIPECCFWSQTCRHRSGQPLLSHLHSCFKSLLLWLKWLSQNLKGLAHFAPPLYFSNFTLLGAKYWKRGHQKQLHIRGKFNTNDACPEEGAGSEKTWEDLEITPHTDPRYRNSLQQSKKWKQQQNPANPGEGRDFDFQSCYIIWFNYLMSSSQPKHRKVYKQTGKHGLFKGKINQQKMSLTKTWWWIYLKQLS